MQHYRNLIAFLCLSAVASSPVSGLFALSPASSNFNFGHCPTSSLCVDAGQAIDGAPDCSEWDSSPPALCPRQMLPAFVPTLPSYLAQIFTPEFTPFPRLYLLHRALLFYDR